MRPGIVSLVCFFLCLVKYWMFNYLEMFSPPLDRAVSWYVILPICFVGVVFTGFSVIRIFKEQTNQKYLDALLSVPFVILFVYFFFIK
jgi:hypothetical protein